MFSGESDAFDVFTEGQTEDYSTTEVNQAAPRPSRKRPAPPADQQRPSRRIGGASRPESIVVVSSPEEEGTQDHPMVVDQQGDEEESDDTSGEAPMPTVTDTFEQDLEREVATSAGLTGKVEGSSIVLGHQVRHQVALPPNWNYTPIQAHVPETPRARTYPFTLDPFQQIATYCIERGESVLVSAHTSAGKTVVAEFAIATALKGKQRVIYTSPIKALSNQKFRELEEQFGDVGLMTGEVTINPSASCLVMTTEILRSMLYRGSEVMREVAWVIFDEIHYMKDPERGVVWEETIIMLPRNCHYVFLSATIPNAMQFAEWICQNKAQPCHVVSTNFRPTPLQHYLFAQGDSGIHLVVDEKGQFREESFQRAIEAIGPSSTKEKGGSREDKRGAKAKENDGPTDIYKIVKMILMKKFHPVIVFSFSKLECEAYAHQVSKLEFNNAEESAMVDNVVDNALDPLSESDKTLPQITTIRTLLRRGIGVHHAGLLPILKEVIEILFQEGLLKVLFATETFSIGLNMPARTVVFTSVQKFDGKERRWISGGEYIQMSGRAGRRGLDERGIVIMMIDEKMEPEVARGMVLGATDPLNSAFKLSYQMILNLMLVEGVSPEYMTKKSFITFQTQLQIPRLERKLKVLDAKKKAIVIKNEESIGSYHSIREQLENCSRALTNYYGRANIMDSYLRPGRVVRIHHEGQDFGWGILTKKPIYYAMHGMHILEVLVNCAVGTVVSLDPTGVATGLKPCSTTTTATTTTSTTTIGSQDGDLVIVPLPAASITGIASTWMNAVKAGPQALQSAFKNLQGLQKWFPDGLPLLDLIEDIGLGDVSLKAIVRKVELLEGQLYKHPLSKASADKRREDYGQFLEKLAIVDEMVMVERELKQAIGSVELKELHKRKRVLRMLGYISHADVVELKGRVACEITNKDVLVLTEMLFTGAFNNLTVPQTVALMSCFAFTEKIDKEGGVLEELEVPKRLLHDAAKKVAQASKEALVEIDETEYVQSFRTELMDVVFAWSKGSTFLEICGMTEAFEGTIVRVFRLLEEQLRQMGAAARAMGNQELQDKFEEGIKSIKRDIVFAPSLYI
ncbi:ATP-dependent RNA helicase mtr4 [Podila minutissima]|nr:ATP-dependent RNA helicase mtr4 [Podila minutissima]